jgi:hypothetical protein
LDTPAERLAQRLWTEQSGAPARSTSEGSIQIFFPHSAHQKTSLDELLGTEAASPETSKASLVREYVRKGLAAGARADPMAALIGDIDDEPGDIDAVVYGTWSSPHDQSRDGPEVRSR